MSKSLVTTSQSALASRIDTHDTIGAFVALFGTLDAPEQAVLQGRFRARFVGPRWLSTIAPYAIALSGLSGFWGKELSGFGTARNLVKKRDTLKLSLAMELQLAPSLIDQKPCARLCYPSGFPWRWLIDEIRVFDANLLVAMTVVDLPVLRKLAFPFLLERA